MRKNTWHSQLQAIKYGIFSEVIGCAVFVIEEQTRQVLNFGFAGKMDILFSVLVFIFGNVLAFVPVIISSSILSKILHKESLLNKLTLAKAVRHGSTVGAVTGIVIAMIGIIITNARGSPSVYLWYSVEITIIASASGAWAGKKLARHVLG